MSARWAPYVLALACAGPSPDEIESPRPPSEGPQCERAGDVVVRGECVDPTGEHDAAPALARAVATLPREPAGLGTPLALPEGAILRLDDADGDGVALRIDRRVILEARGAVLRVSGDFVGLRLTSRARHSTLRDLTVEGRGPARGGVGVDVRTHGVRIDNLWVRRIETAIRAHSRLEDERSCSADTDCACDGRCECLEGHCASYANANTQRWTNVLIVQCGTGISVRGGDANASLIAGAEILGTPHAIVDDSFLGNVYVGPTLETAREQSIALLQEASYSTVVGAYIERNSARAIGPARGLFVGGNAVHFVEGNAERVGSQSARLTFWSPETNLRVTVPGSRDSVLAWRHPTEDVQWQLRSFGDGAQLRWGFSHRGAEDRTFFITDAIPGLADWRRQHPITRPPTAP